MNNGGWVMYKKGGSYDQDLHKLKGKSGEKFLYKIFEGVVEGKIFGFQLTRKGALHYSEVPSRLGSI